MYREHMGREFPDFDQTFLPHGIPPGWRDTSWHNDACPSFQVHPDPNVDLHVYVDYLDPGSREFPEAGPRFSVLYYPPAALLTTELVHTDDWAEVLATVEAFKRGWESRP